MGESEGAVEARMKKGKEQEEKMKQQEGKEGAEEGENKEPDKIPVRLRGGTGRGGRENIWGGNKGAGKEQYRDKGRRGRSTGDGRKAVSKTGRRTGPW